MAGFRLRITAGDVWGGLAASAVALPQTMAFGVALFAMAGLDPAAGAVAGMVGAALLCLMTGSVGGADGMISAPTGPTLVLLGGAITAMVAAAIPTPTLLAALAALIVLTGVFQIVIGWSGGGRLIKYIPYPVISGFMTGSALLMFASQWKPASGLGAGDDWADWRWIPVVAAVVTFVATRYMPRLLPKLPGTIA
ncbi:MAG: SulP family inorganic anion transporter, partial [Proteobacteria bacterium]|nr:SulP family inorganic anion transporter [Pseudomonadota bacterium]